MPPGFPSPPARRGADIQGRLINGQRWIARIPIPHAATPTRPVPGLINPGIRVSVDMRARARDA